MKARITRVQSWWGSIFTVRRWAVNPFQMYAITFLLIAAIAQIQLGAVPGSVQAEVLDRQTTTTLAIANLFGGVIALMGLHMRDLETALWVEFWGYCCLVFVMVTYVWMVTTHQVNPDASYGFGLSEAFTCGALHRSIQILLYKRARRKRSLLIQEATDLRKTVRRVGDE